jgi:hypothetical protein
VVKCFQFKIENIAAGYSLFFFLFAFGRNFSPKTNVHPNFKKFSPSPFPHQKSISQKIGDLFLKTKEFATKYPLHFLSREFVKFCQEK